MTVKTLRTKRDKLLRAIRNIGPVFHGSLAQVRLTCGKDNCRCQQGQPHPAAYVSYRHKGKSQVCHVSASLVPEAEQFHGNWRRLKTLLQELAHVQATLWKETAREHKAQGKRKPAKARRSKRRARGSPGPAQAHPVERHPNGARADRRSS